MNTINPVRVRAASAGDAAVGGLLHGLAAGLAMAVFLVAAGLVQGQTPASVLGVFTISGEPNVLAGLLGHLALSAVLGLVWGVLYGSLLRRLSVPAWVLGAAYGLALYVGAAIFVVGATGLAAFAPWQLLAAHALYGLTLGLLSGRMIR